MPESVPFEKLEQMLGHNLIEQVVETGRADIEMTLGGRKVIVSAMYVDNPAAMTDWQRRVMETIIDNPDTKLIIGQQGRRS